MQLCRSRSRRLRFPQPLPHQADPRRLLRSRTAGPPAFPPRPHRRTPPMRTAHHPAPPRQSITPTSRDRPLLQRGQCRNTSPASDSRPVGSSPVRRAQPPLRSSPRQRSPDPFQSPLPTLFPPPCSPPHNLGSPRSRHPALPVRPPPPYPYPGDAIGSSH